MSTCCSRWATAVARGGLGRGTRWQPRPRPPAPPLVRPPPAAQTRVLRASSHPAPEHAAGCLHSAKPFSSRREPPRGRVCAPARRPLPAKAPRGRGRAAAALRREAATPCPGEGKPRVQNLPHLLLAFGFFVSVCVKTLTYVF